MSSNVNTSSSVVTPEGRKQLPTIFQKTNYCDGSTDWCLDVRFTAHCDNACGFCIAAEDMKSARDFNPVAMLHSVKAHLEVSALSIIGGESLLFLDKLLDFMKSVENEAPHIKNMYLTTALPYTLVSQRELFNEILSKTSVLNVSLQHYDDNVNNFLLKAKKKFSRINLLKSILEVEENRPKIRVHLNLVKGGIDTTEELSAMLYVLRDMGVQDVKINELMNAPDDYVSFEDMTGITLNSAYAHGCSTEIDFFPGISTTLKRSCFVVEPSRQASKEDLLKLIAKGALPELEKDMNVARVLYEDGFVANRWQGDAV